MRTIFFCMIAILFFSPAGSYAENPSEASRMVQSNIIGRWGTPDIPCTPTPDNPCIASNTIFKYFYFGSDGSVEYGQKCKGELISKVGYYKFIHKGTDQCCPGKHPNILITKDTNDANGILLLDVSVDLDSRFPMKIGKVLKCSDIDSNKYIFIKQGNQLQPEARDQSTNPASAEQQKTNQIFQMNRLIAQIHLDLKALKTTHGWLSSYDDPCLLEGGSLIFYLPKLKKVVGAEPQFPDQLVIRYEPINIKYDRIPKGGEDKGVFQFPSLNIKVCAQIIIRGKENEGLADLIRQCIVNRCQSLKAKLKK